MYSMMVGSVGRRYVRAISRVERCEVSWHVSAWLKSGDVAQRSKIIIQSSPAEWAPALGQWPESGDTMLGALNKPLRKQKRGMATTPEECNKENVIVRK